MSNKHQQKGFKGTEVTGKCVPVHMQRMLYGGKLLKSDYDVISLPHGVTISLIIMLCGGGSNCDICYETGSLHVCSECDQVLCTDCNNKVHKHPKRSHHITIVR